MIWIAALVALLAQQPETMSLLGEPLYPPALPKAERRTAEADFAAAHAAYEKQPADPAAVAALSRANVALGRVGDAIEVLIHGLEVNPDHPALLFERGRALVLIRKFAVAERDLRKAAIKVPAAQCTLAFALYLQANFAHARDAYAQCPEPGIWAALADRRANPVPTARTPAAAPPAPIRFPGAPPAPKPKEAPQSIESAYVEAIEHLLAGDQDAALAHLKKLVAKERRNGWMDDAYIAAEADYARLYKPTRKKKG